MAKSVARYPLLALLEGISHADYHSRFFEWNPYAGFVFTPASHAWFDKESLKYSEFEGWRTLMASLEGED